jgi:hypothetical protein
VRRKPLLVVGGLAVLAAVMVGVAQLTAGDDEDVHPLGTEVVVGHNDVSGGQPGVRTQIGLTVLAVRTGTQQELEENGLEVDPEDETATPYYVEARFANRGPNTVKRNLDVGLEDSDGNLVPRTLIFGAGGGSFEPCEEVTQGTLKPGESYESCTLVLVPEGVDVARVHYLSDEGPDEPPEFVYWATE